MAARSARMPSSARSPLTTLFLILRAALFVVPWLVHLLVADVLLSTLLPLSAVFPDLAYDLASRIAASVWHGIQFIFTRLNHADIVISGLDALPPSGGGDGESAIVVANHVSWTDFYLIQELAIRTGMLGRCRWFAKRELKWVPFLGWGLWAMGMPLVSRRWTDDRGEMDRVFRGVVTRRWPMWLISFSEATRYTSRKRKVAETWCAEHSKPLGPHVLYPRTKGFVASVQSLRKASQVKAVYDMTLAYAHREKGFMAPPTFVDSLIGPRLDDGEWRFLAHVERFELSKLPQNEDGLKEWLEARWVEKGERLEALRVKFEKGEPWGESAKRK